MVEDQLNNESIRSVINQHLNIDDVVNNELDDQIKILKADNNERVNEKLSNMEKTNDKTEFASNKCDPNDDIIMLPSNLISSNKIKLIKSIGDRLSYYLVQEISLSQYNAILTIKNQDNRNTNLLNADSISKLNDDNNSHTNKKNSSIANKDITKNKGFDIGDNKKSNDWKINNLPFVKLTKLFISKQRTISVASVTETVNKRNEVLSSTTDKNKSFRIIKRRTKLIRSKNKDVSSASAAVINVKKLVSNSKQVYLKEKKLTEQPTGKNIDKIVKLENEEVIEKGFQGFLENSTPRDSIINTDNVQLKPDDEIIMDESKHSPGDIKLNLNHGCKCYLCNEIFSNVKLFTKHIKIHTECEYICTECNKSYKYSRLLKSHFLNFHNTQNRQKAYKDYNCSHCPYRVLNPSKMRIFHHERIHSRIIGRYTCDICNAKYDRKYWFQKHQLLHE